MKKSGTILGEITRRTPIYRVLSKERLFQLFSEKQNALVRPSKWEDPFENFILKAPVRLASGEMGSFNFHNDVFGQCWTLHKTSDAMWRIYSPDRDAVRIRTTVGKLLDSLSEANVGHESDRCFIGRVTYPTEVKLRTFAQNVFKDGLRAEAVVRSLLVKRRAFEHEKEVRLIYFETQPVVHKNGVYRYPLDPISVFNQVMIDPRLSVEGYKALKREIIDRTGMEKGNIKRSLLYKPPEGFVVSLPSQ